jgi:hypothetical protein
LHAPWWRLPTFLSHNQPPDCFPVSSFTRLSSSKKIVHSSDGYATDFYPVGWRRHLNNGCGSWRGTPGSKTKWGGLLAKTRPASRRTPRASRHNDPAITKTRLWIKLWINHGHPLKGRNLHRHQDKNVVVSFHS